MSLWSIERFGEKVSIEFSDEVDPDETFGPLFADFKLKLTNQIEGVLLKVNKQNQGWVIIDAKLGRNRKVEAVGDLIYFLSDKIIYHLVDRISVGHCIHAACVAKDGQAFVMPASSGSGKSSFTCWLVANGFDYITDELTILLDSGKVSAIPRPMQIKEHGMDAITPLLRDHSHILKGEFANAISAKNFGGRCSSGEEWQLKGFIFPQYREGIGFSFDSLESASAAMQLMGSHVNARNFDTHGFREMSEIARKITAYKLEYGGFGHLPNEFDEIIFEAFEISKSYK